MRLRWIVVLALTAGLTYAQDARSVLETAARTMGAANLKTIQYSGNGWDSAVGQSYNLTSDWPRVEVSSYTRAIDYDADDVARGADAPAGQQSDAGAAAAQGRAHHGSVGRRLRLEPARRYGAAAAGPVSGRSAYR